MSKFSDLDPLLSQVNISSTASTAEQEKFWYFSDQIDCIAEHGLTGSNVKYSRISVSDSKIFDPNGTPSEGFQKKFGEMVEDANKGTPTVTAINLNSKHWVAGMLRETANGKLQFIYNDSS
ncbi:MAG: hypothetical protein FJX34_04140, partial [Alphaproteobacteria bacterium]|nr:hypothetical protein [Alphaproteobacteria bacterium]